MQGHATGQSFVNQPVPLHCVFHTYRRSPVLVDVIWHRAVELIDQIAVEKGYEVVCRGVMPDHVHLLLRIPPMETARAMNMFKGILSRRIFQEFPDLRIDMHGNHLWAAGYYARTVSRESMSAAVGYIMGQGQSADEL